MRNAVPIAGARGGGTDALDKHHQTRPPGTHTEYTHSTPHPIAAVDHYRPCMLTDNTQIMEGRSYTLLGDTRTRYRQKVRRLKERMEGLLILNTLRTPTPSHLPSSQLTTDTTTVAAADPATNES